MRDIGHFIGGKQVKGGSGRTGDVFDPNTGEVQAKVALASTAEVRAAVENAKAAQPEWAATNPQRRARVMMKFLELAQRDYDKLADLLAREHGIVVVAELEVLFTRLAGEAVQRREHHPRINHDHQPKPANHRQREEPPDRSSHRGPMHNE